jgi:hypothetical protein
MSPIEDHKFGQLEFFCEESNRCNNEHLFDVWKVFFFFHQYIILLILHQCSKFQN